ncbi:hypothetical protein BDR26DRAFT_866996 [Obelidium mucronatum]|nr:hypothetical protein BDR26DRAFT_866996 [Obelidium mucronatum]
MLHSTNFCSTCTQVRNENLRLLDEVERLRSRIKHLDQAVSGLTKLEESFNSLIDKMMKGAAVVEASPAVPPPAPAAPAAPIQRPVMLHKQTQSEPEVVQAEPPSKYQCSDPTCGLKFKTDKQRDYHDWDYHASYCAVTFLNEPIARHVFRSQRDKLFHCFCGFTTHRCKVLQDHAEKACGDSATESVPKLSTNNEYEVGNPKPKIERISAICDRENCPKREMGSFSDEERRKHEAEYHTMQVLKFRYGGCHQVRPQPDGTYKCPFCEECGLDPRQLRLHANRCGPGRPDTTKAVLKKGESSDSTASQESRKKRRLDPPPPVTTATAKKANSSSSSSNTQVPIPCPFPDCPTVCATEKGLSLHNNTYHNVESRVLFLGQATPVMIARRTTTGLLHCPCKKFRSNNAVAFQDHAKKCRGTPHVGISTQIARRSVYAFDQKRDVEDVLRGSNGKSATVDDKGKESTTTAEKPSLAAAATTTTATTTSTSTSTATPSTTATKATTPTSSSATTNSNSVKCPIAGCPVTTQSIGAMHTHKWTFHNPTAKVMFPASRDGADDGTSVTIVLRSSVTGQLECPRCTQFRTNNQYSLREHCRKCELLKKEEAVISVGSSGGGSSSSSSVSSWSQISPSTTFCEIFGGADASLVPPPAAAAAAAAAVAKDDVRPLGGSSLVLSGSQQAGSSLQQQQQQQKQPPSLRQPVISVSDSEEEREVVGIDSDDGEGIEIDLTDDAEKGGVVGNSVDIAGGSAEDDDSSEYEEIEMQVEIEVDDDDDDDEEDGGEGHVANTYTLAQQQQQQQQQHQQQLQLVQPEVDKVRDTLFGDKTDDEGNQEMEQAMEKEDSQDMIQDNHSEVSVELKASTPLSRGLSALETDQPKEDTFEPSSKSF